MRKEELKKIKLPDKPGVYFFKKDKRILYIGKATSLRDRVKSYFSKDLIETRGTFLVDMVFKAGKIDYQATDSVLEALILEANLIKKHQPKYNTREKDDKSFNYVRITKEELPKVVLVRGKELGYSHVVSGKNITERTLGRSGDDGQRKFSAENFRGELGNVFGGKHNFAKIFGPYPNGGQLKEAVKIIRRIFPFLDDKSKNYLEFYKQINLVPDLNDRKLYLQNIRNIILFFEGKKKMVLKNLEKEMKEYAKKQEFEKAGEIKRQIFALKHINDVALIKNNSFAGNKIFDPAPFFGRMKGEKVGPSDAKISLPASHFRIEAYDIAHMGGKNMVGVMVVVEGGETVKNEYRKFRIRTQKNTNDTGALKEVLERRLAHTEWTFPSLIVVDGGKAQINTAKKVILKARLNIPAVSVLKDEKHKPKDILGDKTIGRKYEREILFANSEAHRFAINYHKKLRNKNFLR
ncbi:MAG: UvrB/UvrC motif-containing protein [Candidatus Paceibacterota bacterium]|jgi:excinuclease ABC subunit C